MEYFVGSWTCVNSTLRLSQDTSMVIEAIEKDGWAPRHQITRRRFREEVDCILCALRQI